ncbi:MAG: TetR/AcrR family transcriptional regulator [Actinomycetia bacterium]|nr:TetR/AcrR family transcriptional regulator [Actinomycetes bacterium]
MVEKATTGSRRGRPRQFDPDQVVEAAMGAFFAKGFESTTLADLEAATGVDRSTLYNSFDGKSGLYHQATALYLDRAAQMLFDDLGHGTDDGLADIITFLERLRAGLTADGVSPGCLIVNDMASGSDPEATARYRAMLDSGLAAALGRAAGAGHIDPASIDGRASLLSAAVIGINLVSAHTGDNGQVSHLVSGAIAEVSSWRAE